MLNEFSETILDETVNYVTIYVYTNVCRHTNISAPADNLIQRLPIDNRTYVSSLVILRLCFVTQLITIVRYVKMFTSTFLQVLLSLIRGPWGIL